MVKKYDIYLILFFLLLAGVCFFWMGANQSEGTVAIVEQNGKELYRFSLDSQKKEETIDIGGPYHIQLLLEPGAISFSHSDCHDQVCVRTGKISHTGQVAVCLPAKVSVRIENGKKGYDGYTG